MTKVNRVGIRAEDKNVWERRVPLVPDDVADLVAMGIPVQVQSSHTRVFPDSDFAAVGAQVVDRLDSPVVVAVKEVPVDQISPNTAYLFFSHTIKGQAHNMALLERVLQVRATLVDYEPVVDANGRRLIAFGRYAGLAGMIDALWAYGQRLAALGHANPLAELHPAHQYADLDDALRAVRAVGPLLAQRPAGSPVVIGVTGGGNVAQGVLEVLDQLPVTELSPEQLATTPPWELPADRVLLVRFAEQHTVAPADGSDFDLARYRVEPAAYRSVFAPHLAHLTILVNAIAWDHRAPRLVSRADLAALGPDPQLVLLADLSCDIDGGIEATVRATDPDDPVFVYDPATGQAPTGFSGPGFAVLAVDNLPCELPRAASVGFSSALRPFVADLARADYSRPFTELDLPDALKGAVIAHHGELTSRYSYLADSLPSTT